MTASRLIELRMPKNAQRVRNFPTHGRLYLAIFELVARPFVMLSSVLALTTAALASPPPFEVGGIVQARVERGLIDVNGWDPSGKTINQSTYIVAGFDRTL